MPYQKYRDVFKILCAMEDEKAVYLLLGVENQSNVHYAMPVKNMVYDSLEYAIVVQCHHPRQSSAPFYIRT